MEGAIPRTRKRRLFCCQGGCLRIANGKASERSASHAPPADVGRLQPIPNRLHTRVLGNFGQAGIGAASRERTQLFPTRRIRLPQEWWMNSGQYRQCWRPCLHLCPNTKRGAPLPQNSTTKLCARLRRGMCESPLGVTWRTM